MTRGVLGMSPTAALEYPLKVLLAGIRSGIKAADAGWRMHVSARVGSDDHAAATVKEP